MAIIRYTKDATIRYAYLNIFPDQFKTEKGCKTLSWATVPNPTCPIRSIQKRSGTIG